MNLTRRAALALAGAGLVGCTRESESRWTAQWVGAAHERGHRLRDSKSGSLGAPALTQRASVIVVGAGIAGLAAARRLGSGVDFRRVIEPGTLRHRRNGHCALVDENRVGLRFL